MTFCNYGLTVSLSRKIKLIQKWLIYELAADRSNENSGLKKKYGKNLLVKRLLNNGTACIFLKNKYDTITMSIKRFSWPRD